MVGTTSRSMVRPWRWLMSCEATWGAGASYELRLNAASASASRHAAAPPLRWPCRPLHLRCHAGAMFFSKKASGREEVNWWRDSPAGYSGLGLEMATGTRNPSTRRVLPDKDAGMEWICTRGYVIGRNPLSIRVWCGIVVPIPAYPGKKYP